MNKLAGRVALITGAAHGMGRAIALAFADEGASAVVINYRSSHADALATVAAVEERGCRCIPIRADVTRSGEVQAMFEQVAQDVGRLDILVNNAGFLNRGSIEALSEDDWDLVMDINLKAPYLCIKWALPLLRRSDRAVILNTTSGGSGMRGNAPRTAHYYASKAGLATPSKCLSVELAPIRVNCLAPAFTDTGFGGTQPGTRERVRETTPLGRLGQAEDVARAAVFLASEDSSFITGQALVIDGGRII